MLYSAYPNPFNPSTSIKFDIASTAHVDIKVFDISGNYIDQLLSEVMTPGNHEIKWDAKNLPSGVYLVYMNAGSEVFTEKVLLLK